MRAFIFAVALMTAASAQGQTPTTFATERATHRTAIRIPSEYPQPLEAPPQDVFERTTYTSPAGQLGAYITPDAGDGRRHPAIIWITGGESNSVGDVWSPTPRENDQNATAYRTAGIVLMFPTLRGGNGNPGRIEGMYGEIDDVLAAAHFLAHQPYVDPQRIYLGGHSTGGTLVFLTAAASDRFRAVFSFGPVSRASRYGEQFFPTDLRRLPSWEERLRAPIDWMNSVRTPLFVIEGSGFSTNDEDLREMRAANTNPNIRFMQIDNASHFSVLAPTNEIIARRILADGNDAVAFELSADEIQAAFPAPTQRIRSGPRFTRRPTTEQLFAHYPEAARQAGIEGRASVRCVVQPNLHLDECTIVSEDPPGYGFGAAAIEVMRTYFEVEPTLPDGSSIVGGTLTLPMRWLQM